MFKSRDRMIWIKNAIRSSKTCTGNPTEKPCNSPTRKSSGIIKDSKSINRATIEAIKIGRKGGTANIDAGRSQKEKLILAKRKRSTIEPEVKFMSFSPEFLQMAQKSEKERLLRDFTDK